MASNVSAKGALNSYSLFNATDIKSFIINQLQSSENSEFSGCSYLGSNMNALIDVIAVMTQQILFHFSVNTSEASFATANLYESMCKLVNILNYKTMGKHTSMLPVRFTIDVAKYKNDPKHIGASQITIPRFTHVAYNSNYFLKNEIIVPVDEIKSDTTTVDALLFEGELKEAMDFIANGDEFETFTLNDSYIGGSAKFITDNFFVIYVDEDNNGQWQEYTETTSLFMHDKNSQVFERRFNEDMNYEFKFGNGIHGKKLNKNSRIIVFYIVSSGEKGVLGGDVIERTVPFEYSSQAWNTVLKSNYSKIDTNTFGLQFMVTENTGNGTNVSYPESVQSIRANAPRIFASQNRLFTLGDYKTFILKNFKSYIKDVHVCNNDEYTRDYLRYYYNIGLDSPQEDSRLNIAQVEFMTSTNFNNIYCFTVPNVNTIIGGKIPNYLNNLLKQEVVNSAQEYKGFNHNLVMLDPIYKAITFGSFMDDTDFNENQLKNKLVLVRNRLSKYSYSYIKGLAEDVLKNYFNSLTIGSEINLAQLTKDLNSIAGVKRFYIRNHEGVEEKKLTFYVWNPLYSNEDNYTTQQDILNESFVYPYFYNLDNIANLIEIEDE